MKNEKMLGLLVKTEERYSNKINDGIVTVTFKASRKRLEDFKQAFLHKSVFKDAMYQHSEALRKKKVQVKRLLVDLKRKNDEIKRFKKMPPPSIKNKNRCVKLEKKVANLEDKIKIMILSKNKRREAYNLARQGDKKIINWYKEAFGKDEFLKCLESVAPEKAERFKSKSGGLCELEISS